MTRRPRVFVLPITVGVGLTLAGPPTVFGQAPAPGGPQAPRGTSPFRPSQLGDELPPLPMNVLTPGGSLTPDQAEALRNYERRLAEVARSVDDPALRATALNLVGRGKIVSRQLDEAHQDLSDAASAAMQLPSGLVRDLRLMSIITNLVALAHEQIVEAVPNNPPMTEIAGARRTPGVAERKAWLDRALHEWNTAAELGRHIANPTFRNEKIAEVVMGEAADALKIGRDAGMAGLSRMDLEGLGPDLLKFSDLVLRQATADAEKIDRPVWSDKVLAESAVDAARSRQYVRALAIAQRIPRPVPRSEVLIRTAEEMARQAGNLRQLFAGELGRGWDALESALKRVHGPTADPAAGDASLLATNAEASVSDVQYEIDALAGLAESLRRKGAQLHAQFEHDRSVLKSESAGASSSELVRRSESVMAKSAELGDAIADLRTKLEQDLDRARGLPERERPNAIMKVVPTTEDPAVRALREKTLGLAREVEATALPIDQASTRAYNHAGTVIASVPETDPRTLTAHLLIDSLVKVGRFEDARAGTSLFGDPELRYFVLGEIAENQGRRGLARAAALWIEAEVPEDRQAAMYRRVTQGVLTTVDQVRSQSLATPGPEIEDR